MHGDQDNRIQYLFNRYYAGIATPAEEEEFMAVIRSGAHDAEVEKLMKVHWLESGEDIHLFDQTKSKNILTSILSSPKYKPAGQVRPLWLRYAAAAAILLVVAGLWTEWNRSGKEPAVVEASEKGVDMQPGGDKALLTLSDGAAIELDKVKSGLVARQGDTEIRKREDGMLVYDNRAPSNAKASGFNKVSTPRGGQYKVLLPDGSKVWLNASSSIRFPSVFPGSERSVEITGEAYFEVTKDQNRPFTVRFNGSAVQVLGTSFNIMAYPEEGASRTTLVEGEVSIRNESQQARLRPGQQAAVLPGGRIQTTFKPIEEAVAWKDGMFYFKNAGVQDVMRQLSRWYDVEVSYRGQVPVKQFTGQVSRDVNLSEIIGMLRYAGVNCSLRDGIIVVEP
ncbi:FecR family protein [Dyadobacter sp. MSC1_007]|jgi:transmembrane sensor|uniref:FecR family protein n=1 Tax=Dyadobacter sp. MSC1_007 TaxID=2909264 RepID=UPI00202FBEEB|nr:FecR family protein [Dyadobacter sp. MSC1_007]